MDGLVSVNWRYLPASTLAGDTIGYHWVDEGSFLRDKCGIVSHKMKGARVLL